MLQIINFVVPWIHFNNGNLSSGWEIKKHSIPKRNQDIENKSFFLIIICTSKINYIYLVLQKLVNSFFKLKIPYRLKYPVYNIIITKLQNYWSYYMLRWKEMKNFLLYGIEKSDDIFISFLKRLKNREK